MSKRSAKTHARAMAVLAAVKADERDKQNWAREVSEAQILAEIMARCGARADCRLWRQNTGAGAMGDGRFVRYGTPGQADISGIYLDGRRIEIEVKAAKGRVSDAQKAWAEMIKNHGGMYLLARSADEVELWLDNRAIGLHGWADWLLTTGDPRGEKMMMAISEASKRGKPRGL